MATLKNVFKNTMLYSLTSIILRASSIIFFPIFSAFLTKADYGILSITQLIVLIITSFGNMQMPRGITRFLYDKEAEKENYEHRLMGTAFVLVIAVNIFILAILIPFGEFLFKGVLNDIAFFPYMAYALAAIPFAIIFNQYKGLQKAKHNGKEVFILDMLFFGGNIGLNLLLVVGFKMDALGIIVSTLANSLIMSVYAIVKYYKKVPFTIEWNLIKPVLKYTLPLVPFILGGVLLNSVDTIFLNSVSGAEISGIYYIALTFAAVFSMFKESFNFAFTPWFFENFKKEQYAYIRKLFNLIIWGAGIFAILISMFGYEILFVLSSNPELVEAWKYIPLATFGLLIVFIGQLYNLVVYHGKTKSNLLFISNIGGFVVNLGLCFVFASFFNPYWALTAKISGFFVMGIIQILLAVRSTDFKFNHLTVIVTLLVTAVLSMTNYLPLNYPMVLAIKLTIVAILSVLMYLSLINANIKPAELVKGVRERFNKKKR